MSVVIEWLKDNWLPLTIIGGYIFMIPIVVFIIARFGDDVYDATDATCIGLFWPFALLMYILYFLYKWLIEKPFKFGEKGWKKKHISNDKYTTDDDYYYEDTTDDDYYYEYTTDDDYYYEDTKEGDC